MDCGHDMGMGGMAPCSMSCCTDSGKPALVPGVFLLPSPSVIPAAGENVRTAQITNSFELSRFRKPLSPPPRFA
jgi:hypothetical protein